MPIAQPNQPPVPTPGLTQSGLDIITSALVACGSQAAGEPVSPEDAQAGLVILNQMLDLWQIQRLLIFSIQRLIFTMNAGQQTYACGSGGDFNIPRPARVENYGVIIPSGIELPCRALTVKEWQMLPIGKTQTQALQTPVPYYVWDDPQMPLRMLSYWPTPSLGMQATIYPWIALSYFPDLKTQFTFPPAYAELIKYSLAFRCGIEFPGDVERMPLLKMMADESMDRIKVLNTGVQELSVSSLRAISGRTGHYDFYSDLPARDGGL